MGLDMYLNKRTYCFRYAEDRVEVSVKEADGTDAKWVDPSKVKEIIQEVGYWRKANAIHQWFVENCQGGVDDCRDADVTDAQLMELKSLCESILQAHEDGDEDPSGAPTWIRLASELLPTQSGFFFGSVDYDDGYLGDLRHTVEVLERVEEEIRRSERAVNVSHSYQYSSSW